MKKFIWILLIVLLVGCQQDALSYYQEAVETTETIERAKSTIDASLDLSFDENVNQNDIALFENVNYSSFAVFDKESNQKIVRQYVGLASMGLDTVYFNNNDEEYIQVPFVGKYIKLDETLFIEDESLYDQPPISEEAFSEILEVWKALVGEEDVVDLGNDVIDTPEGEVKVKKFVVKFSHNQVSQFLNDVLDILSEDDQFIEMIPKYPTYIYSDDEFQQVEDFEINAIELVEMLRQLIDEMTINTFEMETYIDVDQYIIESNYNIDISFIGELANVLEGVTFQLNYLLYDLHEKNVFEFPMLTDENLTTIDEILETLMFEK